MSPEQIDIDHGFYIDAVVQALKAAGLTVAEHEALADTHREAYIKLSLPDQAQGFLTVIAWDEERGWQRGYTDDQHSGRGIQGLTDLICDDRYLDNVALPTTLADAVLKMIHTVPDDLNEALAAYLPADPEPGFGGLDPRALAIRIVEAETEDIDFLGIAEQIEGWHPDEVAAMGEEAFDKLHRRVDDLAGKAVVTVEIPDEVTP